MGNLQEIFATLKGADIMYTKPLEPETRLIVDRTLENLGWSLGSDKNKNVFLEQPKTDSEKKKLEGKKPDYVLYPKDGDRPLIIIETKKKGTPLDSALMQGIDYAKCLNAPLVFATDGVFCRSFHMIGNTTPKLNGEDVDEFMREALAIKFLTDWEVDTISQKVKYSRQELIKIFDEANNMLRGDGLRAGIERFGEFANILFLKLISEYEYIKSESGISSSFDTSCSWDTIKNIPSSARIEYINSTVYQKINRLYDTEIFTALTMKDNDILKEIMDKLDPLTLTDVDSDVKGDAFEYFLRASASTKNDLGEYFTPRHIVKTMVRLVNPQIGERIYDPFCGTGGFLIETFRHIHNNMARNKPNEKTLKEDTVFGNEITNTARITKMNMILAGDGHSNIEMKDSLANPVDGQYDVVIANMPYSQKTKYGSLYDVPSNNGDSICVQHCIKAIDATAENGRIALVLPEGFLFRKDLTKAREYLLEKCQLQSIISLPQGVFLPYTGVKTNILYATKVNQKVKSADKRKDFWYFDVKNDGYTLDNHRRKIDKQSDLSKFEEFRRLDREQEEEMMQVGFDIVPLGKVRENSNILVGNRYKEQVVAEKEYDIKTLDSIVDIKNGYSFPVELQGQTFGVPFYKVSDMNYNGNEIEMKDSANYVSLDLVREKKWIVAPKNTIIFPKIGAAIATNKKRILSAESLFDNNVMGLTCRSEILPKFLLYMLGNVDISDWASLSNPPSISKEAVSNYKIPVPSLDVQQQIVDELDGYQRIINGAKMTVDNYRSNIPRNINGELKRLEDIAEFRPSKNEARVMPDETIVSFVPMADISENNIAFEPKDEKMIKEVIGGYTYFKDNDVLLAKITPCFENGKAGVAQGLKNGIGFGSTEFIVIRANAEFVRTEWVYYHVNSPEFLQAGKESMTGTAGQQRIDINFVKGFSIIVPEMDLQDSILSDIKAEQDMINSSKQIIKRFTQKIHDKVSEIWGE